MCQEHQQLPWCVVQQAAVAALVLLRLNERVLHQSTCALTALLLCSSSAGASADEGQTNTAAAVVPQAAATWFCNEPPDSVESVNSSCFAKSERSSSTETENECMQKLNCPIGKKSKPLFSLVKVAAKNK